MSWLSLAGDRRKRRKHKGKVVFKGREKAAIGKRDQATIDALMKKDPAKADQFKSLLLEAAKVNETKSIYNAQESVNIPIDPNVRDIHRLTDKEFDKWKVQDPGKEHFFSTPFIDNIWKVHRPGKLTYRNRKVPPQEIAEWCKRAVLDGVSHAFILLPDREMEEYYGMYSEGHKLIKSGKELLFDIYDAYDIKVHHYPIRDFGTPGMIETIKACEDLKQSNAEADTKGEKIVVHCSAGIGRTGLITSCYLVYTDRLSSLQIGGIVDQTSGYGLYSTNTDLSKKELDEMQKKVWYDTNAQLDLIKKFAKTKEYYQGKGKLLTDEEVLVDVKERDIKEAAGQEIRYEAQRKKMAEEQELRRQQYFKGPKGGIEDLWQKRLDEENAHKDELDPETSDMIKRQLGFDVPPDDWVESELAKYDAQLDAQLDADYNDIVYDPEIEKLKRRQQKRPYYAGYTSYGRQDRTTKEDIEVTCPTCSQNSYFLYYMRDKDGICPWCQSDIAVSSDTKGDRIVGHDKKIAGDITTRCDNCDNFMFFPPYSRALPGECPYCGNEININEEKKDISEEGNEAYYKQIRKIEYEPMEDEEWLKRFGSIFEDNSTSPNKNIEIPSTSNPESHTLRNSASYADPPAIEEVHNGIYKGKRPGYPSRQRIDNVTIDRYAEDVKDMGITDVFILLSNEEMEKFYENQLIPLYEKNGINTHHYPIKDFGVSTVEEMIVVVNDLDNIVKSGGKPLIHCSAGRGRTGTVLSAYFMSKGQDPVATQTVSQEQFLKQWEKYLNGKPTETSNPGVSSDEKYKDKDFIEFNIQNWL